MARILIIEDQEPLSGLYKSVLRQFNHETIFASTGEAGVAIAMQEAPDLIILDLLLPSMSGTEVAQKLRESGILPEVPLIITTALDEMDAQSIGDSLHADAILHKPFSLSSMVNTVSSVLNATSRKALPA
jgi:DNA-binding response OmpR family regulator